jgi:hypothetical protein
MSKKEGTMEIDTSNPVSNGVQAMGKAQKISAIKGEGEKTPDQQASLTEANPDYRISLSDTSKKAVSDLAGAQGADQIRGKSDLSEDEAARVAQQAAEQLAQTNSAISNQAMQQAVDLFT